MSSESAAAEREHGDEPRIAKVVLDSPLPQLDRIFEYEIPPALRSEIAPGMRVKAPLRSGGRIVRGFVLGTSHTPEYSGRLAVLDSLESTARVLTPAIAQLARAVADRQAGTVSDVLRLAIPARSVKLEGEWLLDEDGVRAERIANPEPVAPNLETLTAAYGDAAEQLCAGTPENRVAIRVATGMTHGVPRQLVTIADIAAGCLASGKSVLVLLPDFRDLDLALRPLRERVPESRIRLFDGRLKPKPRYEEFLRALEPIPQIIIGNRAAVYAPAYDLGLIVMWDDGDESYREPHAPYAHAREVALMRSQLEGTGVILASHSPSLEARRLVRTGWLREVQLRIPHRPKIIPAVATMTDDPHAQAARIPEAAWRAARAGTETGPVLIQVGRAGYRPGLACARCRTLARCANCQGPLGQRSANAVPNCTVCGQLHAAWHCPECGSEQLRGASVGHERTAEELGRAFPGIKVLTADGEKRLVEVPDEPALVISTRGAEPVTEHGYRAVLLLDTEGALARESLDAVLAALQSWSNAAALAADGAPVIVTGAASAPLEALRDWQQQRFVDYELDERLALEFPPAVRIGTIRGTEEEVDSALRRLRDLAVNGLHVLGPVPDEEDANLQRAVIRFPYKAGADIAASLKSELVARAAASRRKSAGRPSPASTLRVKLDATDVF
ncbi:primosomal protein N' family DNA-binding protein [Gulosibacter chungangensis]|uniref:Probable replication restart protein PriA n=1 Tax=Gulosibacter chungangensis TaxID=979746 RepID=A0A7J5BDG3_9MICO|nr:primosomal protein N' [Gulosibacter chungangensis]KAB1644082.1 primosomal protein N' [Gulosibacter chungangensis]